LRLFVKSRVLDGYADLVPDSVAASPDVLLPNGSRAV
jgi:hypothetical protein